MSLTEVCACVARMSESGEGASDGSRTPNAASKVTLPFFTVFKFEALANFFYIFIFNVMAK